MKYFSLLVFLVVAMVFAGGEGKISNTPITQTQAINSMADLYTMKKIKMSAQSGNVVVATKWNLLLKAFYNPRQDSSVSIKCRTQQLDTLTLSIPAESWTPKLPPIDLIFKTGSTDSVYGCFQKW